MPAVGRLSGTPASMSASEEPQTVAIDDEPFELGDLRDDADRVGELGRRRQHRADRAPGELAVADLAPAGRTHAAGLADRVGREVVVQQESLLVGSVERVDVLLVLAGAERRDRERLRLAASEERRTVGARQDADLRQNRPHGLEIASVDAPAVVEDVPAHHLGLGVVERFRDFRGRELRFAALRRQRRHHLRLGGVDGGVALLLLGQRIGGAKIGLADCEDRLFNVAAIVRGKVARLLGRLLGEPDDRRDHRLEGGVAGHDGLQHRLFAEFLGLGFDHQHGVGGAGDDEVEGRVLHLLDRRVDLDLALDHADAGGADRPHEGHAGKGERRRRRDQPENVGIGLEVIGQHRRNDLRVAAEPVRKQRPDRTVDEARRQRLAVRRAAFALQIAAGNAAGREGLLLIVNGEREEILAGLRLLGGDDGREHRGFAPGGEHGAVGLTGDAAGLQNELPPAPVEFYALNIEHLSSSLKSGCESPSAQCRPMELGLVIGKTAGGWAERFRRQPPAILP